MYRSEGEARVVRLSHFDLFFKLPSLSSSKCSRFIVAQSLISLI